MLRLPLLTAALVLASALHHGTALGQPYFDYQRAQPPVTALGPDSKPVLVHTYRITPGLVAESELITVVLTEAESRLHPRIQDALIRTRLNAFVQSRVIDLQAQSAKGI